eukprot:789313_1
MSFADRFLNSLSQARVFIIDKLNEFVSATRYLWYSERSIVIAAIGVSTSLIAVSVFIWRRRRQRAKATGKSRVSKDSKSSVRDAVNRYNVRSSSPTVNDKYSGSQPVSSPTGRRGIEDSLRRRISLEQKVRNSGSVADRCAAFGGKNAQKSTKQAAPSIRGVKKDSHYHPMEVEEVEISEIRISRTRSNTIGMCELCLSPLQSQSEKANANEHMFHKSCFKCLKCKKALKTDGFVVMELGPFCLDHAKGHKRTSQTPVRKRSASESQKDLHRRPTATGRRGKRIRCSSCFVRLSEEDVKKRGDKVFCDDCFSSSTKVTTVSQRLAAQSPRGSSADKSSCLICGKTVYQMDKLTINEVLYHKTCFRCSSCKCKLTMTSFAQMKGKLFCKTHFKQLFAESGGSYDALL